MGIFRQFPYTNFHDLNLDEIIKIMREMQDEWTATKTEWASYKDYIDNYFANLNLDEETEKALRALIADGTLDSVIDPVIAAEVAAWLAEHITQPTTPAIDTSLSVAGAAADAKATGDAITELQNDVDIINTNKVQSIENAIIKSRNLYNMADATQGYYLSGTAGNPVANANYCYTDYIEINDNDYDYLNVSNSSAIYFYDENKTLLDPATRTINDYKLAVNRPAGTKYCRFNFGISALNLVDFRTEYTTGYYIAKNQIKNTAKIINIGPARTLKTLKEAVDYINSASPNDSFTIYLDEATYYPLDGFVLSAQDNTFMGLVLPDNVYLEGNGNPENVKIVLDGINFPSNITRNEISALNFYRNNGLKNLTIVTRNVRYCVHDDDSYRATDPVDNAVQVFENVHFINEANTTGDVASYCVGIGAKKGQHFIFKNCIFENEDNTYCAFLAHNGTTANIPAVYDFESCLIKNNGTYGLRFTTTSFLMSDIVNIKGCKTNKPVMLDKAAAYTGTDTAFKFYGYGNSEITFNTNGIVLNNSDIEMMV